jgi:hypothetical protein
MRRVTQLWATCGAVLVSSLVVIGQQFQVPPMPELPNEGLGQTDRPLIPNQPWRVHDLARPRPRVVAPGIQDAQPTSDAVVLFDGKDLSKWTGSAVGTATSPGWKLENGYVEVQPGAGGLSSNEKFRSYQLHLEWASPRVAVGKSQYRGNGGISVGGHEIQILDNYDNETYADGYVGAVYGQWPPLVNPSRKPGEWQTMNIVYHAPKYEADRLIKLPSVTIFMNGVLIQDDQEYLLNVDMGQSLQVGFVNPNAPARAAAAGQGAQSAAATQPAAGRGRGVSNQPVGDMPVGLMGHPSAIAGNGLRYRNIWLRRLLG